MTTNELVDKRGRFEWSNDDKTIKVYPDRDGMQLCIHIEATPYGDAVGSGVCFRCAMKESDNVRDAITQTLRQTIKDLKEQYGYTDQQIIDDLGDPSFLRGQQEELVMKLLREYNNSNGRGRRTEK